MDNDIESLVKATTRGSLILMLGQVSSTLILAIGMLLVARFLGSVSYGSFTKAQSIVQIAVLLVNLGVQQAMVRYIAQYRYEGKEGHMKVFIETGVMITSLVSLFFTLAVFSLSGFISKQLFHEPAQELLIKYLSFSILGQAFSSLAQGVTVGYERMDLRSLISVIYSLFKSIISPLLVYIGLGVVGAALGHSSPILMSGALGLFFIAMLYRNLRSVDRPITHIEAAKTILTYSFPLYLSTLLSGLLPQLYTTMLGSWETSRYTVAQINELIGNYSVVLNFGVLLSFITLPISTTVFPLFSKLKPEQPELEFLYRNGVKYTTLLGYPIIFTVIGLSDQIIAVLFNTKYVYAASYLRIYMLPFLLIGLGSVCNGSLLSGQNRNDINFRSTLAKFVVSLPLAYFAIQQYGAVGLLYTYFISALINTGINRVYIRRIFGFNINHLFLAKMIITSLVSCFTVYYSLKLVDLNPWLELMAGGLLSVLIYAAGVLYLNILTKQDYLYLEKLGDSFGPFASAFKWFMGVLANMS